MSVSDGIVRSVEQLHMQTMLKTKNELTQRLSDPEIPEKERQQITKEIEEIQSGIDLFV